MRALVLLALFGAIQGCANPSTQWDGISVVESASSFAVSVTASELTGLCYAPHSLRANGMLVIDDMPPGRSLIIKRVAATASRV